MRKDTLQKLNDVLVGADKMFKEHLGVDMNFKSFAPTADKEEVERVLEPFSDEIKILIEIDGKLFCMNNPRYRTLDGEGFVVFTKGMEVSV